MKRIIAAFLLILLSTSLSGCFGKSADTLSELAKGKNKEIYLKENNVYVPYLILSQNYEGNILILRKDVMGEFKSISDYSSEYENSPIDAYLSSEYLDLFSDEMMEYILSIDIEVTSKEALYQAGKNTHTITRKAFLLSYAEVNYSEHSMAPNEGTTLSYFTDDQSRVAYRNGEPCSWWLRTPYTGYDSVTWSVGGNGVKTELSSATENGVRPALCLSGDVNIKESTEVVNGETVFVIE